MCAVDIIWVFIIGHVPFPINMFILCPIWMFIFWMVTKFWMLKSGFYPALTRNMLIFCPIWMLNKNQYYHGYLIENHFQSFFWGGEVGGVHLGPASGEKSFLSVFPTIMRKILLSGGDN